MKRKGPGRDLGLTLRMLVVGSLVLVVYGAIAVLAWYAGRAYPPLYLLLPAILVTDYFMTRNIALGIAGARTVTEQDEPELHARVERLSALIDLPKPRIAVIDTRAPNALALGRRTESAVIVVTTGLRKRLDPLELDAVLAHELAHIANRDALVLTSSSFLSMLGRLLYYWPTWPVAVVLRGIGFLLTVTLSRYREFAADRGSALITGQPEQLMSALQKISSDMPRIPARDLRQLAALDAFLIVSASEHARVRLLADHPPLEDRLRALSTIARELEKPD